MASMTVKERARLAAWLRPTVSRAGRRFERLRRLADAELITKVVRLLFEHAFQVTAAEIKAAMSKRLAARKRARYTRMVVYGIKSRGANVFWYVGISKKRPEARLVDHIVTAKTAIARRESSIFQDWLIRDTSVKVAEVLEKIRRGHVAFTRERHWINKLLAKGHPLLNTINAPSPPGKFRCRTPPCTKLTFASRRSADLHARGGHHVEKCSLAAYPFALDPDSPPDAAYAAKVSRRLYYKGVTCSECREVIPNREFLGDASGIDEDGSIYRVCTTCEYNEGAFESTDESGYDFVFAD